MLAIRQCTELVFKCNKRAKTTKYQDDGLFMALAKN